MITPKELYNISDAKMLLQVILDYGIPLNFGDEQKVSEHDSVVIKNKLQLLIDTHNVPILLRGISKSKTQSKLISKLNSSDSLFDGLFLIGDKAKNFLNKEKDIPHPIKKISSVNEETAEWIFDTYQLFDIGPIDLKYFKEASNKKHFIQNITNQSDLIDYYLFGIHTYNSDFLVNFVSTTCKPKIALNNETKDKLVIFLFIPKNYKLFLNSMKLKKSNRFIQEKGLPVLSDSFHPKECEISFKGFILPHLIIGIHDIEKNQLVINPAMLNLKSNWLSEGLEIDQSNFETFIKQTKYQRFLNLTNNFVEKNVC